MAASKDMLSCTTMVKGRENVSDGTPLTLSSGSERENIVKTRS